MTRPLLLDGFCKAGGAGTGYHRAGFDIIGVDIEPQPNYPFEFFQADMFDVLESPGFMSQFDAIHVSPPCQDHMRNSPRTHGTGWMLGRSRDLISSIDLPWVIENVPGAPMRADYLLCGCMFGLNVRRERWFESSWRGFAMNLSHDHSKPAHCVVGNGTPTGVLRLGIRQTAASCREAMGIDWMTRAELNQAIPPAYTEYVGRALLEHLAVAA